MKVNISTKRAVIYLTTAMLIFAVICGYSYYLKSSRLLDYSYFYSGIYIDGVNVKGMTKEQAAEALEREFGSRYTKSSFTLTYDDKIWDISFNSINFRYDFKKTINFAYSLGRTGDWFNRVRAIKSLGKSPVNLIVPASYDSSKLNAILITIKKQIDFESINSTYKYNYGKIVYTNAVEGRKLDIEVNTKIIEARLLNRDFSEICLEVQSVKPQITLNDVKEIKDVLGTFTTKFNSNNYSRAHNIELASKKINNYLLLPGEEFSMDYAIGPRIPSNGYMQAPIIMKSKVVTGTGGGVCQVATTLYNSALLSYLQVTKRVHHSIPLRYVPPGQDATISEGYIDLKFRNNKDYTICIVSEAKAGMLTVKIIGKNEGQGIKAKLRPVIIEELQPPEPEYVVKNGVADNQVRILIKERKGLRVNLYRDSFNYKGALINSELISEDIYKPVRGQLGVSRKTFDALRNN